MTTAPPPDVAAVYDGFPEDARAALLKIRGQIFEVAEASAVGPLSETLKWGTPAYLTTASKAGTTLRLGWSASRPEVCALYVHCQTTLVEGYRRDFPEAFDYDGTRAVNIPLSAPYPQDALHQIIARALTYHRAKSRR